MVKQVNSNNYSPSVNSNPSSTVQYQNITQSRDYIMPRECSCITDIFNWIVEFVRSFFVTSQAPQNSTNETRTTTQRSYSDRAQWDAKTSEIDNITEYLKLCFEQAEDPNTAQNVTLLKPMIYTELERAQEDTEFHLKNEGSSDAHRRIILMWRGGIHFVQDIPQLTGWRAEHSSYIGDENLSEVITITKIN